MHKRFKRGGFSCAATIFIWSSLTAVPANALPAPDALEPSGSYSFPSSFADFEPTMITTNAVATGTARVAEWMRSNQPGDTFVLTGSRLSSFDGDARGRDTYFHVFGQSGNVKVEDEALIHRLDEQQAVVKMPSTLPADEMYLVWVRNDSGFGRPFAVNRTEAWWIGPASVRPGKVFSVYGRNLQLDTIKPQLYIEELNRWIECDSANPYKADFVLPSNIDADTYTIRLHNGHGREYGWSQPLDLNVVVPVVWSSTVINVKDHGAKGDGSADDLVAIQAALASCPDWGTVYFPEGTYLLSDRISSGCARKRLLGDGNGKSIIRSHPNNTLSAAYGMFHVSLDQTEIRDLGFETAPGYVGKLLRCRTARDTQFINCRFSQLDNEESTDVVDVASARGVTFSNCSFVINHNIYAGRSKGLYFEGCELIGRQDNGKLLAVDGSKNVSIIDCTGRSYDDSDATDGSGWCQGRFINGSGNGGSHRNYYIAGNTTTRMAPRYDPTRGKYNQPVDQNTGEQIMFEHLRTSYRGAVLATPSDDTVRCEDLMSDLSGDMIAIISGVGLGQCRLIEAVDTASGTVTISEPWAELPDTSSVVMIGRYSSRFVIYENNLAGHPRTTDPRELIYGSGPAYTNATASCGVSLYGSFFESVVDGNTMFDLESGIMNWSLCEPATSLGYNVVQPSYFNYFVNNTISNCLMGVADQHVTFNSNLSEYPDIAVLGTVWRENTVTNVTGCSLSYQANNDIVQLCLSVFDNNDFHSELWNIDGMENTSNLVCVANSFKATGTGINFPDEHLPVLVDNEWDDRFSPVYDGVLPGAVLELPRRTIFIGETATAVEVPVLNSGTANLDWTAAPSVNWVKVSAKNSDRSVDQESAEETLVLEIDAANAPAPGSKGVVTVESGDQVKQLTVIYQDGPAENPPMPVLSSLTVFGPSELEEGTSADYTCSARFSDGSSVQTNVEWYVNSAYASVDQSGRLTANSVDQDRTVVLEARLGAKSESVSVIVRNIPATVDRLEIDGPSLVDEGATGQFTCTATYSDGSSGPVAAAWSVSSTAVSIESDGLFAAGAVSANLDVTIRADFGEKFKTMTVTVKDVPASLTGLIINGPSSIDEGGTAQLSCTGTYSDGSTAPVSVLWSSLSSEATISSVGLVMAGTVVGNQSATIRAELLSLSANYTLTINDIIPNLTGISISGSVAVNEGETASYTCTAYYSDGSSEDVSPEWGGSSYYGSIDSSGLLTANSVPESETVNVTASFEGKSASFTVTVQDVPPTLVSIAVEGPAYVLESTSARYLCRATYSDGTTGIVAPVWSEGSAFASINSAGLLSAGAVSASEAVSLTASIGGKSAFFLVTLTDNGSSDSPTVTGLTLSGPDEMFENESALFSCEAVYSDGTVSTVVPEWSVSAYAQIDAGGSLTAGNVEADIVVTVTALFDDETVSCDVLIMMVGTQVVFPLSGFEGKQVKAELWDETAQQLYKLGEMSEPKELVVENVNPNQWYWLSLKEFNETSQQWESVHDSWICM